MLPADSLHRPITLAPLTGAAWRTPWEIEAVAKIVVEGIVETARARAR
jgi:hypothetical protein